MNVNSLSYHLAFAILQLIRHSDGDIYHRLNLTVLIKDCVKAMGSKSKELEGIEEDLSILRNTYEPEMDLSSFTYVKRARFEIELDNVKERLLKITNDEKLITQSVMQEIMVGKFGNEKKEGQKQMGSKIKR